MSFVPEWRICPKCKRKYSWDPDVGNFRCPYCSGKKSISLISVINNIVKSLRHK